MPTFYTATTDNQILLQVAVLIPKTEEVAPIPTFTALVDTGAQITLVSPKVVEQLGATSTGVAEFISANNQCQETKEYWLNISIPISERLSTPDGDVVATFARGEDLSVLELPYNPPSYDVLLGMDFLQRFHITMWNGTFVLSN